MSTSGDIMTVFSQNNYMSTDSLIPCSATVYTIGLGYTDLLDLGQYDSNRTLLLSFCDLLLMIDPLLSRGSSPKSKFT